MILFDLFITFFKIGAFSFGGGYAMISLISEAILKHGWMNESEILNFIGVETVVPGPISVNMATFVGYQQAGFFGRSMCYFRSYITFVYSYSINIDGT